MEMKKGFCISCQRPLPSKERIPGLLRPLELTAEPLKKFIFTHGGNHSLGAKLFPKDMLPLRPSKVHVVATNVMPLNLGPIRGILRNQYPSPKKPWIPEAPKTFPKSIPLNCMICLLSKKGAEIGKERFSYTNRNVLFCKQKPSLLADGFCYISFF